jgi:hypothetical protein
MKRPLKYPAPYCSISSKNKKGRMEIQPVDLSAKNQRETFLFSYLNYRLPNIRAAFVGFCINRKHGYLKKFNDNTF